MPPYLPNTTHDCFVKEARRKRERTNCAIHFGPVQFKMPDPSVKRLVRKSHVPPQHFSDPLTLPRNVRRVRFYHPGYPKTDALLLSLPALDQNGIHHQTALDVCAIIANNRWDGFFTADREGQQQISTDDLDACLDKDEYYFQIPGYNGQDGQFTDTTCREGTDCVQDLRSSTPSYLALPTGRFPTQLCRRDTLKDQTTVPHDPIDAACLNP